MALDATASREPSWQHARRLHAELFSAAVSCKLAVQLCYYRGFGEFQASPWLTEASELLAHLNQVTCLGGPTQIATVLQHAVATTAATVPTRGIVFVGDAVEESASQLSELAAQCRLRKIPLFIFQDGRDSQAANTFELIARLSGGAYAQLDDHSAEKLKALLGAVVRYIEGGRPALTRSNAEGDKLLLESLSN